MERPNAKGANNFIVGLFVFVALIVGAGFVVFMGGSTRLGGEVHYKTMFNDVRGLSVGAPVFLSGIQIGRVSNFEFPEGWSAASADEPGIIAVLSIYKEDRKRIKEDSLVSITTQGVLGDKVIVISPGSRDSQPLKLSQMIQATQPKEFGDMIAKGGSIVDNLNTATTRLNILLEQVNESGRIGAILNNLDKLSANLASTTQNIKDSKGAIGSLINGGDKDNLGPALLSLRHILGKIDKGEGTLGALVNDSSLHEDLRVLLGGAKRSQMVRFLIRQAISAGDEKNGVKTDTAAPPAKSK